MRASYITTACFLFVIRENLPTKRDEKAKNIPRPFNFLPFLGHAATAEAGHSYITIEIACARGTHPSGTQHQTNHASVALHTLPRHLARGSTTRAWGGFAFNRVPRDCVGSRKLGLILNATPKYATRKACFKKASTFLYGGEVTTQSGRIDSSMNTSPKPSDAASKRKSAFKLRDAHSEQQRTTANNTFLHIRLDPYDTTAAFFAEMSWN